MNLAGVVAEESVLEVAHVEEGLRFPVDSLQGTQQSLLGE
jgi:hypothetical protein